MIHIAVITRQGAPAGQAIAADFGPNGGTIGRADTNTLVLVDPDRTVSRVHAQVLCRDGQYFVIDRGSNPMQCNGVPLGSGKEAALTDGTQLVVGSFELRVRAVAGAAAPSLAVPNTVMKAAPASTAAVPSDDPFADLLAGLAPPPSSSAPVVAPKASSADSLMFPDPMQSGSRNAQAAQVDPFANLLGPASSSPSSSSSASGTNFGALDDFSDLGAPPAHGKAAGIDELFGGMGGGGGIGGDPLALSPLADPLLQPNTASDADPLAALQRAAPATPVPRADHLPIDQFGFTPPKAITAPPPSPPPATPRPELPQFDDITGQPIRISGPDVALLDPIEPLLPPALPAPRPQPQPSAATAAKTAAPAVVQRTASDDELLAAFLRGLGSTHQTPEMLTPGLMERIGTILRSATEGTLQLLLTRQEFKREVRAEVTMIASQANNPLKFSPTVEVALAHLLGPGVRGFMQPEAAMRDAYNDLRAHQFGVMVGMRAALAHVIARFEPEELEKKITSKSALDALFSANRKAKLWDQFVALYGGIASEAEDDFHNLFGKAFLEAYEEQMARLKSDA
jgi:FHA domain-containing protein